MKEYHMIIERDSDGWYVGSVPGLPGCHTQGKSIEELTDRMREAIELYLDDADMPEKQTVEFVGVHRVSLT